MSKPDEGYKESMLKYAELLKLEKEGLERDIKYISDDIAHSNIKRKLTRDSLLICEKRLKEAIKEIGRID